MPFERACHLQENRAKFPMSHAGTRCKTRLPQPARVRPASPGPCGVALRRRKTDRKSTRLNSSHLVISYAVFCLKKKKHTSSPAPAAAPHTPTFKTPFLARIGQSTVSNPSTITYPLARLHCNHTRLYSAPSMHSTAAYKVGGGAGTSLLTPGEGGGRRCGAVEMWRLGVGSMRKVPLMAPAVVGAPASSRWNCVFFLNEPPPPQISPLSPPRALPI